MTQQTRGRPQCPGVKARQDTPFDRKSRNGCISAPYRSKAPSRMS
jgi:hypothetical protein